MFLQHCFSLGAFLPLFLVSSPQVGQEHRVRIEVLRGTSVCFMFVVLQQVEATRLSTLAHVTAKTLVGEYEY